MIRQPHLSPFSVGSSRPATGSTTDTSTLSTVSTTPDDNPPSTDYVFTPSPVSTRGCTHPVNTGGLGHVIQTPPPASSMTTMSQNVFVYHERSDSVGRRRNGPLGGTVSSVVDCQFCFWFWDLCFPCSNIQFGDIKIKLVHIV